MMWRRPTHSGGERGLTEGTAFSLRQRATAARDIQLHGALLLMISSPDNQMRAARRVVSERLRHFFSELRDALDPDTDDFFERVMQQAKARHDDDARTRVRSTRRTN
jgi:hypothetical protein